MKKTVWIWPEDGDLAIMWEKSGQWYFEDEYCSDMMIDDPKDFGWIKIGNF